MIKIQFYIRFSAQLRRTRPELINNLEDAVAKAASDAGAAVEAGHRGLLAFFDEEKIGFWLNIVIFLEKAHETLKKAASELYGYALVLGRDVEEISGQKLCLLLSGEKSGSRNTGIWCPAEIEKALEFYFIFNNPQKGDQADNGYREIREFKPFADFQKKHRQRIVSYLSQGKNALVLGPSLTDIRDGIYCYTKDVLENIPPLVIHFGVGGPVYFSDAYTPKIRSFVSGFITEESAAELDKTYNLLFTERLRDEWSSRTAKAAPGFFVSLLKAYSRAVKAHKTKGVIILDALSNSGPEAAAFFRDAVSGMEESFQVLACSSEEVSKKWREILPLTLNCPGNSVIPHDSIPFDIWELSYNIYLLGRYFPVHIFPLLFEEKKLGRELYYRAVEILTSLGMAIQENPQPELQDFVRNAEKHLGSSREKCRSAVRSLVLSWVLSGRLLPCFNLLRILGDLGERAEDDLVLKSIRTDVLNGTWRGIDDAVMEGYFSSLVGEENAPALEYVIDGLRALVWGGSAEVQRVFQQPVPDLNCYKGCEAHVHINLAAFYIGNGNSDAASEAARKAMHLNRSLGDRAIPAFRFFSLANFSKQRMDDALEYISFALDHAEKTEQHEELFLSRYYASSINFLYGNLSKAEKMALSAEDIAAALGQTGWSVRARFFRGRINFETGRYKEALDIFESLDASAGPQTMVQTVRAWIFRTKNFLNSFSSGESADPSSGIDSRIFEIEAAYYAGDYKSAATMADDFLLSPEASRGEFLFTEQPDWRSGFSQCEYLFQPEKIPGARLAWVYRTMAQCALQTSGEGKTQILSSMQRYLRDELLPDTDPFDIFYFHALYRMLRDSGKEADINTTASMAFRRLQRRAGRIDDSQTKKAFLTLSRWNSDLYHAAREHKLI